MGILVCPICKKELNKIDKKVSLNKQEKRPYIGICFSINDYDYIAPLTSPK